MKFAENEKISDWIDNIPKQKGGSAFAAESDWRQNQTGTAAAAMAAYQAESGSVPDACALYDIVHSFYGHSGHDVFADRSDGF